MTRNSSDSHGLVADRAETVLAIVDLISDFSFDGGDEVARAALPVAIFCDSARHDPAVPRRQTTVLTGVSSNQCVLFAANDAMSAISSY